MPAPKEITLTLRTSQVKRIVEALRHKARCDAGHSQGVEKFYHTETHEWADAGQLSKMLKAHKDQNG